LKKSAGSVQFWFYKLETERTKPNRTQTEKNRKKTELNRKNTEPKHKKPSQNRKKPNQNKKTEPNRFELVFILKNRTETGSICFFFKISVWLFFLIKTELN
jgi:hypothetical protein